MYSDRVITPVVENSKLVGKEFYFPRKLSTRLSKNREYDKNLEATQRNKRYLVKFKEEDMLKGVILNEYENSVRIHVSEGSMQGDHIIRKSFLLKYDGKKFDLLFPERNFGYIIPTNCETF